jgi:hypothetical protein
MNKDMADTQQSTLAVQPATAAKANSRTSSRQKEEERWIRDALEDDAVREILKRDPLNRNPDAQD